MMENKEIIQETASGTDEEKIKVSFSSLNWLEVSPAYYRAMSDGQLPKEQSASMDFGKATHCYILRPNDFNKEYFVMECATPENVQQSRFVKELLDNKSYLDAYKNAYSTTGKSDKVVEQAASKMFMQLKPYADSLKDAGDKIILSTDDFNKLTKMSDNVLAHKGVRKLLDYTENHKDSVTFVEKEFLFPVRKLHDDKDLFIHGFIDQLIFDPANRKMIINELKTTSGAPSAYRESFEKYHTARQLGIYTIAAGKIFESMYPDIPLKEMTPEWNIIVAQTTVLNEVKVYSVTDMDITAGLYEYKDLVNRFVFHYKEGWEHTQEYYTNDGIERL